MGERSTILFNMSLKFPQLMHSSMLVLLHEGLLLYTEQALCVLQLKVMCDCQLQQSRDARKRLILRAVAAGNATSSAIAEQLDQLQRAAKSKILGKYQPLAAGFTSMSAAANPLRFEHWGVVDRTEGRPLAALEGFVRDHMRVVGDVDLVVEAQLWQWSHGLRSIPTAFMHAWEQLLDIVLTTDHAISTDDMRAFLGSPAMVAYMANDNDQVAKRLMPPRSGGGRTGLIGLPWAQVLRLSGEAPADIGVSLSCVHCLTMCIGILGAWVFLWAPTLGCCSCSTSLGSWKFL